MKRCPNCNRIYVDATFQFCLDDGADLIVLNNQKTEQFAIPARVADSEKPPAKFNWLAFSLLGGAVVLIIFGVLAAGLYVVSRGNTTSNIQANTPDNRNIPITSQPLFGSDDETEIKVLMEKVSAAFVAGDTATLDYFLADEYTEENSNDEKYTKKDVLKPQTVGERISLHYTDMKVAVENDTATVTGIGESKFRLLGTLVTQRYKFKSRLVKKDKRWRGVYSYSEFIN